eukprot:EG_transcript_60103
MNYTVVGDVVNVASRLESLNKQVGTRILMGPFMYSAVSDQMTTRQLPPMDIKGKAEKLVVFELLGQAGLVHSKPSLDQISSQDPLEDSASYMDLPLPQHPLIATS